MHIVISGDGEIAYQLARTLQSRHDVVVVEDDPDEAARFERLDVQVLRGNANHPETLRNAGVDDGVFIACRRSDEHNIIACLTAKRIGEVHTICFVSKEEYVHSFAGVSEGNETLAIDRIIWPQYMLAEEIARIVLVPEAIDVEIFAGGRMRLVEYRVPEESPLLGRIQELGLPRGVLAVAVREDDELFVPSGLTRLDPGNRVVFMGKNEALETLHREFMTPPGGAARIRGVVIVGGGAVGLTLAKRLEQQRDLRVKIIEVDRERCDELASELPRSLVLHGDGTDLGLLSAEHVDQAKVLVSVTSNDEKNLLCSLLARQMEVPRVITRVNRRENVALFETVGIDAPLHPMTTAINVVLNTLDETRVQLLASVEGGKAAVLEVEVPGDYDSTWLRDLPPLEGAIIAAIMRAGDTIVPHGDDRIEAGDRLLVFATAEARERLLEHF